MHRYVALGYFLLLHGVGFVLAIITQYSEFYKPLFSTLMGMLTAVEKGGEKNNRCGVKNLRWQIKGWRIHISSK